MKINKVAIDCRIFTKNTVGISVYIRMILGTIANKKDLQLFCLVNTDDLEKELCKNGQAGGITFLKAASKPLSGYEHFEIPYLLIRHSIDLFHITSYISPVWLPCRYVYTIHDIFHLLFPKKDNVISRVLSFIMYRMYYSVIVKNVAKKACAIITITQSSKKDIEKYITNKTNIHVTLLGSNVNKVYDNNFEKLGTKFNIKTPGYILFFGNHRINKNSERVIAAYSLLVNENQSIPDLVLNIKPNKMVKRILENTKAEKKCRFIGFVDEEIKWSLFSHALFLAAPSLYEGFGLFLVEAMLTNTPIVTSKIPCLQEVAGSAAEFVDPYSVLSIAAGMKALLENDALRKRLAAEGAKQCLKYSWEKCAEETYTIYKDVLTQPIK